MGRGPNAATTSTTTSATQDTSGYIGTDPMYQNYANETEKPLNPETVSEAEEPVETTKSKAKTTGKSVPTPPSA